MAFSRSFQRYDMGGECTEEIFLSDKEERECEQIARQENLYLVRQCLADARNVIKDEKLMDMQSHVLNIALSLFSKRARSAQDKMADECAKKFQKYWVRPEKRSRRRKVKVGATSSSSSFGSGEVHGCKSKNSEEIDGKEFTVETAEELIDEIEETGEVHINYVGESSDHKDIWLKRTE